MCGYKDRSRISSNVSRSCSSYIYVLGLFPRKKWNIYYRRKERNFNGNKNIWMTVYKKVFLILSYILWLGDWNHMLYKISIILCRYKIYLYALQKSNKPFLISWSTFIDKPKNAYQSVTPFTRILQWFWKSNYNLTTTWKDSQTVIFMHVSCNIQLLFIIKKLFLIQCT